MDELSPVHREDQLQIIDPLMNVPEPLPSGVALILCPTIGIRILSVMRMRRDKGSPLYHVGADSIVLVVEASFVMPMTTRA